MTPNTHHPSPEYAFSTPKDCYYEGTFISFRLLSFRNVHVFVRRPLCHLFITMFYALESPIDNVLWKVLLNVCT